MTGAEDVERAQLTALLEINKKIGALAPTEALLTSIAEEAARLLDVDNAGFRLVDGDELVVAGLAGRAVDTMLRPRIKIGESFSGRVVAEGRSLIANVESIADQIIPEHLDADRRLSYTTFLGVPLRVGNRTIGVFTFRARRPFTAADQALAEAFAGQAAIALEHARLYREAAGQAQRTRALADVGRLLSETLDPDVVGQRVADSICRLLGAQSSCLYRLESESGRLVKLADFHAEGAIFDWTEVLTPGVGIGGLAVSEGGPVASPDVLADPRITYTPEIRRRVEPSPIRALMGVPLLVRDRLVGALAVADHTGRVFDREALRLGQAFADEAAVALENARLYGETERRRREAEEMARVARTLTESLDVTAVGQRTVESVLPLFRAKSAGLYVVQPDGSLLTVALAGVQPEHFRPGHIIAPGEGVAGRAVMEGTPTSSRDLLNDPRVSLSDDLRGRLVISGLRAVLAVPMRAKGVIVGVLTLADDRVRDFGEAEIALLQTFGDQAALALENARLYREAREYGDRLRALEEVNRLVSSSLNFEEVLQNVARAVAQFFDAPFVSVWVLDERSRRLRRSVTYGNVDLASVRTELEIGEGVVGWAIRHRQPVLWADAERDPRVVDGPVLRHHSLRYLTAYPIAIGERVLGAFAVSRATPPPLTPESEALLGSLAAHAAVALDNARLYSETTRRLEESRALLEVAEILNSTLDPRQLLKRVAIKIAQVCRVDRCSIELWDGGQVVPLMSQFADGRKRPDLWSVFVSRRPHVPAEVPAHARAIETHRPVVIDDTSDTNLLPPDWIQTYGLKSYMVVPLIRQDQVKGVMNLDYCERVTPFAAWQVDLAMAIAGQLALALENTRLYAEARERLQETTTLLAVGDVLSRPAPGAEVMRLVAREVARAFGADGVGAYVLDGAREALVPVAGYHVPPEHVETFRQRPFVLARFPWLQRAWQEAKVAFSSDPLNEAEFDPAWVGVLPPHSVLFAPTIARGEPVGGLFLLWWQAGRAFTPAEVRLVEGIAAQVGLAMENMELARQTEIKLRETETLLSLSRALSSTLELQALLRHFLRRLATALDADSVGIWTLSADGAWLEPMAGYRVPPDVLARVRDLRLAVAAYPFYAEAIATKHAVFAADGATDPRIPPTVRDVMPHRSHLFAPIVAREQVIGGLAAIWWDRLHESSPGELVLMETIANQAGVALENARLFEENRRQVEELSVLHDLARAVTGQLDRAALIEAIEMHTGRVLDVRSIFIALWDEKREDLEVALRVVEGTRDRSEPLHYPLRSVGLMSVVFETGRPLRSDDYLEECRRRGVDPIATSAQLRHWLGVPLIAGDTVLGVLTLRGGERAFSEVDERMLANIAQLAALALRSARLFEERMRAYRDLAAAQDQLVRTEKLRALGEMASGVAHDFNNLLASILGRAQLTLQRVHDPQLRQWLQVIERSALDGAQTVRRLQEFTRVRRDQPLVPVDLNQAVRDALEITQSRWHHEPVSRGVLIDVHTELGPVPFVAGDPGEMREALTNLILNAVDAMPAGGRLTLATSAAGAGVELTVADTGVGIPESVKEKIFDPFFTTKGPQGTGLGLSMTYGILSRYGARITVQSEEGRGSTFRLSFLPSPATEPVAVAPGASAGPISSLRCLVVDDEAPVGMMLGDVLEAGGHKPVVVSDGEEAIARFRAEPFDIVFTDLAMPRVSGWQVARAVKEIAPGVIVFLVTGFGVELSAAERRAHSVDAVLEKPLKIQEILDAVAQAARRLGHAPRTEDDR